MSAWYLVPSNEYQASNGTDVPVEAIKAMASYYVAISRMTNTGETFFPEQAIVPMEGSLWRGPYGGVRMEAPVWSDPYGVIRME